MSKGRFFISGAALALGLLAAQTLLAQTPPPRQDDTLATANGNLVIHPIGHASVLFTWNGKKILNDPAPNCCAGRRLLPAGATPPPPPAGTTTPEAQPAPEIIASFKALGTPDLILIGHAHFDHFNIAILEAVAGPNTVLGVPQMVYNGLPADLKAKAKILAYGDSTILAGIPVQAVPAYNISPALLDRHPKGEGNGYIITLGGKRVYLAGDTEETPELKNLSNIDIAFLPMNRPTNTPQAAAQWVRDFKPKIVYPYHYSDGDLSAFVQGVGDASELRLRQWY